MSIKTRNFFKRNQKYLWLILIVGSSFLVAETASANIVTNWLADKAGEVVGGIIGIFIWALGLILILVIKALILIASYQDFIGSQAVLEGWVIVRDIANMFFVVILLIIAFSTILHIENYSYKKWLPKLILMAILINFSKTICGLMIDVAQIVMLTFVNSFKDVAGGNFIDMLGIRDIVTMEGDVTFTNVVGAYILGLIYMIIAVVVLTTMLMILAMRIVMIWIYVVLSPLAYLLSAFPGGAQYASKWWKDFTQNLIVGPVLAFFIWLSFAALQTGADLKIVTSANDTNSNTEMIAAGTTSGAATTALLANKASSPGALIKFVIGIGMLIGGLKIAQEIGGAAGSIAGKGMSNLNKVGMLGAGFALGRAKFVGRQSLGVAGGAAKLAGWSTNKIFNKGNNTLVGQGLQKMGDVGLSYRRDLMESNRKAKIDKRKKFLEKIGVGAETADKFNQNFGPKNIDGQSAVTGLNTSAALGTAGAMIGGVPGALLGVGAGTVIGYGLNKWSKARDQVFKDAEANVEAKQEAHQNALAKGETGLAEEKALKDAKENEKRVKGEYVQGKGGEILGGAKGLASQAWNSMINIGGKLNAASTEFSAAAAKKLADVEVKARQIVDSAAGDPTFMEDAAASGFYSSNGQQENQEAFIRHLAEGGAGSKSEIARANIKHWIDTTVYDSASKKVTSGYDENNAAHVNKLRALAKSIAATDKEGDVDIGSLAQLINSINSKSTSINGTVASFKPTALSYRNTGVAGEAGAGGIYVDSFAKGKNTGGAEVLGADFEKLRARGIDIDTKAEGIHINPDNMKAVADALISQIKDARIELEAKRENMKPGEYESQKNTLDVAEEKLYKPEALQGLSIVNTKSGNFGREARLTSAYHEQIHGAGIKDEELTEGLAQALMSKKLYGRNPETKGRHSQEIAAMAKAMSEGGASNSEVLKAMTAKIAQRSSGESKSRADRVLKMESGKHETEKEFVSGDQPQVVVDTKGLEKKIVDLGKVVKNLVPPNNAILLTKLFHNLGNAVAKGEEGTMKAIKKLNLAGAKTPLEFEVAAGEISKTQV